MNRSLQGGVGYPAADGTPRDKRDDHLPVLHNIADDITDFQQTGAVLFFFLK